MVTPRAKRTVVTVMKVDNGLSERKACQLVTLNRSSYRYQAATRQDDLLRSRLKELATQYPVYGYLLLHALLKQEGLVRNKKRTYRLYREENRQVRTKRRKKLDRPRPTMVLPMTTNERWSMDFVSDQLANGRRFRVLNVVDEFSRECVGQLAEFSISGQRTARFLTELISARTKPQAIVCDNGTEFTSKAVFFWAQEQTIKLNFIEPGKPTQNAFVESFNGKFRAACLNQHWFRSLAEAKTEIDAWRQHYNEIRPHSSLKYLSPFQFAEQAR